MCINCVSDTFGKGFIFYFLFLFIFTFFLVVNSARYGTQHVLVLADFPPSMRTTDLEKLFENFRDREVVIRWVNDMMALAVFRTTTIGNNKFFYLLCFQTLRE